MVFLRIIHVLRSQKYVSKRKVDSCKLMAVFGSGGHTFEMLTMLDSLSKRYTPKVFVIADTDNLSKCKIEEMDAKDYQLVYINRSREVAQSWTSTIFSTFR